MEAGKALFYRAGSLRVGVLQVNTNSLKNRYVQNELFFLAFNKICLAVTISVHVCSEFCGR